MTKNFKSYILSALAVAAIALSGCSKSDEGMTPAQKKDFSVVLTGVSTKTTNDGMSTLWAANDAINLFHAPLGGEATTGMEYVSDGEFSTTQSGATATFTGTLAADFDETLTYNWYAFYPYTKQITTPANSSAGYTYVGGRSDRSQTQTGNNSTAHICGTNYPIAGILNKVAGSEKPVITMRHLSSLVAVKVTNGLKADPITVSKVSITADGVDIVGSYYIDFTDPNNPSFVPSNTNYVSSTANLEVTDGEAIAAGESATFYLAIKPFTVNEGDDFTVSVTATNGAQEKVISAEKNYVFSAGKMKTINFTYDQQEVSYDFNTVAELNTLAMDDAGTTAKSYFGKLTNAVITFVSPDTKTVIISDGSASIMYYNNAGTTLKQGQTYSGDLTVSALNYKSQYTEISSMDVTLFTGDGAVVEPTTLTIAQLVGNYTTYQNEYCKVTELEVTAIDGKNISVTDGTNNYIVYLNSGTAPCVVSDKITAIGTVTKFNTTEEIKVWKADDIIVTSHTATKHKVTYSQPATGGTFYVCYASSSSTEIKSGDEVMEGEVVTIQATPASGFKFNKWTVTGATPGDASKATTSFTMGSEDVTIAASFVEEGATDWSLVESSNVLMKASQSDKGYEHTVNLKPAIKIGTSSVGGYYKISLPAGTTKLHLHAVAWSGVTGLKLNVSGATATPSSISLTANSDITGNGTAWTIANPSDYYFMIEFSNIVTDTEITLTSSIAKRYILWGINTE